jgi:hypothetical protein
MGLDIDIVKVDKRYFDELADADRKVDYLDMKRDEVVELGYFRKHYCVRDVLMELCDGRDQCTYHELTQAMLFKARQQFRQRKWGEHDVQHAKAGAALLDKVLAETDFSKEVVALSWIS